MPRQQLTAILATIRAEDEAADEQLRRRVRISLHHNHLPKLADAGVITYDEETVAATEELESVVVGVSIPDVDFSATSA